MSNAELSKEMAAIGEMYAKLAKMTGAAADAFEAEIAVREAAFEAACDAAHIAAGGVISIPVW